MNKNLPAEVPQPVLTGGANTTLVLILAALSPVITAAVLWINSRTTQEIKATTQETAKIVEKVEVQGNSRAAALVADLKEQAKKLEEQNLMIRDMVEKVATLEERNRPGNAAAVPPAVAVAVVPGPSVAPVAAPSEHPLVQAIMKAMREYQPKNATNEAPKALP